MPILYIDTPKLNDKNDNVAVELSKRQWIDWQDLRFASLTSKKVSKKMESLAKNIRKLIDEKVFEDVNKNFESEYLLLEAKLRKTVDVETKPGLGVQAVEKITQQTTSLQSLYAPISHANHHSDPPKSITILIQPTDDWERNKRRIKILHGTLISFYGRDKFSFQFFVDGKGHLIDFPNDTTRVCPELLERLKKLLGEESWRIDEIKFVEQEG